MNMCHLTQFMYRISGKFHFTGNIGATRGSKYFAKFEFNTRVNAFFEFVSFLYLLARPHGISDFHSKGYRSGDE